MSARLEQSFPPTLIMTFENDFRSYTEMSSYMSCIVAPLWAQSLISFFNPLGFIPFMMESPIRRVLS